MTLLVDPHALHSFAAIPALVLTLASLREIFSVFIRVHSRLLFASIRGFFFASFVLFLDRHSLGDVYCSYSRYPCQRTLVETPLPAIWALRFS